MAMAKGQFQFLNQTINLAIGAEANGNWSVNWDPDAPRLWRFHLHYHESLLELADQVGVEAAWMQVESWLSDSRNQSPYTDPDAWHPFCLSMRLPNWLVLAGTEKIDDRLSVAFWQSVSQQVDWLWQNPEWDLGGNHLLENLRTLAIADAVLEGDLRIDRQVLYRWINHEIETQILTTGEHYERTPTYHALMLLAIMEIANAAEAVGVSCLAAGAAKRMARFLASILHPDGGIPLLGDSVFAETPSPKILLSEFGGLEELTADSDPVHQDCPVHQDYWVWRSAAKHRASATGDRRAFLLFDVGNSACDHLPAHAHADLFCLSASAFGERLIVDVGTFDYEDTSQREYCRSTRAHNTARIDERSQSDLWSRFRMGRRGHVLGKKSGTIEGCQWCLGWHDAYADIGAKKTFRLVVAVDEPEEGFRWLVADWFVGQGSHRISSPLHIGPGFKVDTIDANRSVCRQSAVLADKVIAWSSSRTMLTKGEYFPNFGVQVPIDRIEQSATLASDEPLVWTLSASDDDAAPAIIVKSDYCGIQWGASVSFQIDFSN